MALDGNDLFEIIANPPEGQEVSLIRNLLAETHPHFLFLTEAEQDFLNGIQAHMDLGQMPDAVAQSQLKNIVVTLRKRVKEANGPIR